MLRLQVPLPDRYTAACIEENQARIRVVKEALGDRLVILGHHYQRDEVIQFADARGDSFNLARFAAENERATEVVFCGVHFMAEAADILTGPHQRVYLPDLNAGCSMADMADTESVEECWDVLAEVTDVDRVVPVTYMNSSAALKAFVGRHGGAVCTSSNARAVLEWALARGPGPERPLRAGGQQVLFFPDQHLGRNTGYQMGFTGDDMVVWDPRRETGGLSEREIKEATLLLWRGHCSVHQRFTPDHIHAARAEHPGVRVVVHPECSREVVELADEVGSTEYILSAVDNAPAGSVIAVGTEIHMVQRLAREHPDKTVFSLDPLVCPCSTMFRIDAPHLAWCLERIFEGDPVNRITVDDGTAEWARVALRRMLEIT